MSEIHSASESILAALNELVSDFDGSGELDHLEDGLSEFNLFEAIGAVNSELRHSSFLGWLLDPIGSHGLGDVIVKRLLQRILIQGVPHPQLTAVDLDLMDLSDLEVRREWSNIDILLLSPGNKLAVVIENKIGAVESEHQLRDYRRVAREEFPEKDSWRHVFVFLTIDGVNPTDEAYAAVPYQQIVNLLDATITNRRGSISPDVANAVSHYTRMLRRNHMEDSELIKLARKVYAKHRAAFDFIFEHRPDGWSDTRGKLLDLIIHDGRLIVDKSTERSVWIRFYPLSWSQWANRLSQGTGWKSAGSDQFMLCQILPDKNRERARLELALGPGPLDDRERIAGGLRELELFKAKSFSKWNTILAKPWRKLENDGQIDPEENARILFGDLKDFLANDGPKIEKALELAFRPLAGANDRVSSAKLGN